MKKKKKITKPKPKNNVHRFVLQKCKNAKRFVLLKAKDWIGFKGPQFKYLGSADTKAAAKKLLTNRHAGTHIVIAKKTGLWDSTIVVKEYKISY